MSHAFAGKQHHEWYPFVHNMAKPLGRNYIPNELDPSFHGKVPKPAEKLRGKDLFNANLVMNQPTPSGQEALMYGWGKGKKSWKDTEPSDIARQAHNGRSMESLNNLDFSNYYKATK